MKEEQDKFLLDMDKYNVNMTWFEPDNPPDERSPHNKNCSRFVLVQSRMSVFSWGCYDYSENKWEVSGLYPVKRWAYIGPPK